jgi:hypothetical protein
MADLNYTTDIAPIQNKYFDDSGMTTKLSGGEREMLMRQYAGMTARRIEGNRAIVESRRQQAELDREQRLLLEDAQKRRRQVEIDSKLGKATRQLNRALKGETLADKALGVAEVQNRFAELSGSNPTFQTLIDAANRKVGVLMDQEDRAASRTSRSTTAPKADPSLVRQWQKDFDFVSGIQKKAPDAAGFGGAVQKAAFDVGEIERAKRIAKIYGIDPDKFEDDDQFVSALDMQIRQNAPVGLADGEETGPSDEFDTGFNN